MTANLLQRVAADCPLYRHPEGVRGLVGLPLVALPQDGQRQREEHLPGRAGLQPGGLDPRAIPRHGPRRVLRLVPLKQVKGTVV